MPDTLEVASPASPATEAANGDADRSSGKGAGNLTLDSAAQHLLATAAAAQRKAESPTATGTVAKEEEAPEPSFPANPEDESAPVAEAESESAAPETTAETEAAEEATEAKTEGDEADTEVLSPKSSLTKEQQAELNARIAKERRKRGDVERRNEELANRLSALEAQLNEQAQQAAQQIPPPALNANDPLANVHDPRQLVAMKQQAKEAIRFAEGLLEMPKVWKERQDPETGESVRYTKVGNQEVTEDMVREHRRLARITLEDHIPAREQFLEAKTRLQQQAQQRFSFLKDRSSPDFLLAQQIQRNNPWLANLPNADEIVAVQIKGIRAIEAEEAARVQAEKAKAEKPKPKIVPVKAASDQAAVSTTGSATRAPSATGAKRGLATEQERMTAKRGITAEEAMASLIRQERIRNVR
jgi:hypothetical protein